MPLAWNHRHIWLCLWNPNNCLTSSPLEKKFMGSHNNVLWYIMNLLNLNCFAKHRRGRINKWLQHIWLVSAGSCFLLFSFMSPQSLFYLSLHLSSCRQHDHAGALGIKIQCLDPSVTEAKAVHAGKENSPEGRWEWACLVDTPATPGGLQHVSSKQCMLCKFVQDSILDVFKVLHKQPRDRKDNGERFKRKKKSMLYSFNQI